MIPWQVRASTIAVKKLLTILGWNGAVLPVPLDAPAAYSGSQDKSGPATLTNGSSLVLPGGANIPTAAADITVFVADGTTIKCSDYVPAEEQRGRNAHDSAEGAGTVQYFHRDYFSTALNTGKATGRGAFVSGTYTTPTGVKRIRVRGVGDSSCSA
jgi:hypothetical protein